MAGNKISAKGKGKEDRSKASKTGNGSNDDTDDIDFALLRKPILTSITGFAQARKIFDVATEELKSLLSDECDILYECKVCRNIFRSLANFISHKRVYCKENFNSSVHSHFFNINSVATEMLKIKRIEQGYQDSLKHLENIKINNEDDRVPLTKDLTAVIEKINNKTGLSKSDLDNEHVVLQKIPESSVAVFQSVHTNEENLTDSMRIQIKELDNILSQDKAILQNDGKFTISSDRQEQPDSVIQISDDEEDKTDGLKCKICDVQFSTQKTLKFHMKYKHLESRLVYPCPDCFEIFSTSWSVYRHLFKVHRKTAAQIRRLRESIQAKAFKMNNPPAIYERKKNNSKQAAAQKMTEEERLDQENQAWMDNMEGDGELPRCGGCGRTFERRAALAAHTHTCQPRSRALARRPLENKKIEIQIRRDYNKGPASNIHIPLKNDSNESKSSNDSEPPESKTSQKEIDKNIDVEEKLVNEDSRDMVDVKDSNDNDNVELVNVETTSVMEDYQPAIRLPLAQQAEKNNILAFKQRIQPDIELDKLLCKKCEMKCSHIQELFDHMAEHYKWMRYSCKLCNYKHYEFEKLPEHVKTVHKLKGDSDFYFSTVKAIDGVEALELSNTSDESIDAIEDSRRPSRCSSDSSRLSDDSSSSCTRSESRKRKTTPNKSYAKKRKDTVGPDISEGQKDEEISMEKVMTIILGDMKSLEENSSDMDDTDDKTLKRPIVDPTPSSVASRRPIRKKTKPKNEDFEYDLSNLLKMEAQGYRESLPGNSSKTQTKKKAPIEATSFETILKDCSGALAAMSKKSAETAAALIKFSLREGLPNIFIKPHVPKSISKVEKASPKKDASEECKESSPNKVIQTKVSEPVANPTVKSTSHANSIEGGTEKDEANIAKKVNEDSSDKDNVCETVKTNINLPSVVPIKFRRQSLEVIKNPLVNKNITDFTKSGMKTKILVIKPINRNKDGTQTTPLKFQTIKFKDTRKKIIAEDLKSDQMKIVTVPKMSKDSTLFRTSGTSSEDKNENLSNNNTNLINGDTLDSSESACDKNESILSETVSKHKETISSEVSSISLADTEDFSDLG